MANDRPTTDERIADAMERIAAALEQMNAVRIWPGVNVQPGGGGTAGAQGTVCPRCGTWYSIGNVHYCGTGVVG